MTNRDATSPGAAAGRDDALVRFLEQMLLMRRFDEAALRLVQSSEIRGVVHPYIGQEASAAGVCGALEPGDRVVSYHRGHGHCIAAGVGIATMMAELFGRATGLCRGKGGSMHVADFSEGMLGANGIVGAGVPIATGAALSEVLDGGDRVVVAFFGDGASGQGVVFESLNVAALWRLPVLFVCENNAMASATPLSDILAVRGMAEIAPAHGVPAECVDGRDVTAVHAAATRAVSQLRAHEGPRLIECTVDRWGPHASRVVPFPDPRDPAALEEARRHDPIERLRRQLVASETLTLEDCERLDQDALRAVDEAISFARSSPFPAVGEAVEGVFA